RIKLHVYHEPKDAARPPSHSFTCAHRLSGSAVGPPVPSCRCARPPYVSSPGWNGEVGVDMMKTPFRGYAKWPERANREMAGWKKPLETCLRPHHACSNAGRPPGPDGRKRTFACRSREAL